MQALLRRRLAAAAAGAAALGRPRWDSCAEAPEPGLSAPPVFAVRHAQSVSNVNLAFSMKKANEDVQEVVARLLAQRAERGDAAWQAGCKEIERAIDGGRDWYRRWVIDDSHLPPELRERDSALTAGGIADTLAKAEEQVRELPAEGPRRVLLVVSPLTRTMMTAVLLFHRLPEAGVEVDVVLEPGVAEVLLWPYDMVACLGREPSEALAEIRDLLPEAPPSVRALIERVQEASADLPATWWARHAAPGEPNKLTILRDWSSDLTDMDYVRTHREGIFQAIERHVVGRQCDYCAVYVVCHGLTMAKLLRDPSKPLDIKKVPSNLACCRLDVLGRHDRPALAA